MKERPVFKRLSLRAGWRRSCPQSTASINVFRATLLSIVLTLAAGQDAALFCSVWCNSGGGMAGVCEHQTETASPGIIAGDDCAISGNAIVFVREDARRSTSAPTVQSGVLVPQFGLTPPASGRFSGYEAAGRQLLESRPLVITLRI